MVNEDWTVRDPNDDLRSCERPEFQEVESILQQMHDRCHCSKNKRDITWIHSTRWRSTNFYNPSASTCQARSDGSHVHCKIQISCFCQQIVEHAPWLFGVAVIGGNSVAEALDVEWGDPVPTEADFFATVPFDDIVSNALTSCGWDAATGPLFFRKTPAFLWVHLLNQTKQHTLQDSRRLIVGRLPHFK